MSSANDAMTPVQLLLVKLHNRRVAGQLYRNGEIGLAYKKLDENGIPVVTKLRLTNQAAQATVEILIRLFELSAKKPVGVKP